jgi:hypothetical protein
LLDVVGGLLCTQPTKRDSKPQPLMKDKSEKAALSTAQKTTIEKTMKRVWSAVAVATVLLVASMVLLFHLHHHYCYDHSLMVMTMIEASLPHLHRNSQTNAAKTSTHSHHSSHCEHELGGRLQCSLKSPTSV